MSWRHPWATAAPPAPHPGGTPGLIQAWIDTARASATRGILSGIALPSPMQLLHRPGAGGAAVDPGAAAALRQAIEGSVMQSGHMEAAFDSPRRRAATPQGSAAASDASLGSHAARRGAAADVTSAGGGARYSLRHTPARAAALRQRPPPGHASSAASGRPTAANAGAPLATAPRSPPESVRRRHDASMGQGHDRQPGPSSQTGKKTPLVFMHGVGFGIFPYLGFVWKLLRAFPGAPAQAVPVQSSQLPSACCCVFRIESLRCEGGSFRRPASPER